MAEAKRAGWGWLAALNRSPNERPAWVRYGIAVLCPVMAFAATLGIPNIKSSPFFTLFTAAIALATWLAGKTPGLLSVLLSLSAGAYLVSVEASLTPLHWNDRIQFVFFSCTALLVWALIAALQAARAALQASEERFRTLVHAVPQMLWSTDAEGTADYLSQQWCDYTGQSQEEASGAGWQLVLHPEERERVAAAWQHSVASGELYELETRLRRADGSYRWMLARGAPLRNGSGRTLKWFGTCTDIHEQKMAEETLRTAEKLAATARMASALAHQINNPLAAVTNLLYLLEHEAGSNQQMRQYGALAQQELARVAHIARQTLGLYRESSAPAVLRLSDIVDNILELYASDIVARQVTVEKQYQCEAQVVGLPGELRQMVSTLLLNALEAVPVEGMVKLRLQSGRDRRDPARRGVRFVVADNGHGIPPEHRNRIFEPFFTTKAEKATGLGLWVAQTIVQHYGGTIRLHSSTQPSRHGTTVSVFLPSATAADAVSAS